MSTLFIRIVKISTLSTFIIFLIIFIRFLIREKPKKYSYLLWFVLFFRLINPFFLESRISVIPKVMISSDTFSNDIFSNPDLSGANNTESVLSTETNSVAITSKSTDLMEILMIIWIVGICVLLGYIIYSKVRLNLVVKSTVRVKENIFQGSSITTPFVMGLFKPRIYIPTTLSEIELEHVIKHEKYHIWRKDQWVSYLTYFITVVYWFNPIVWLAYYLFLFDMETSCDEGVLVDKDMMYKRDYAITMFSTATRLSNITLVLGFVKGDTKMRIKNLLQIKKAKKYDTLILSILIIVTFLALNTTPMFANNINQIDATQLSFLPEGWQGRLDVAVINNQVLIRRTKVENLTLQFDKNQALTFRELAEEFVDSDTGIFIHDSLHYNVGDIVYVEDTIASSSYDSLSDTTTFTFVSSSNETIYFKGDLREEYLNGNNISLKFNILPYNSMSNQFEILDYNYSLQILDTVPKINDYLNNK